MEPSPSTCQSSHASLVTSDTASKSLGASAKHALQTGKNGLCKASVDTSKRVFEQPGVAAYGRAWPRTRASAASELAVVVTFMTANVLHWNSTHADNSGVAFLRELRNSSKNCGKSIQKESSKLSKIFHEQPPKGAARFMNSISGTSKPPQHDTEKKLCIGPRPDAGALRSAF